MRQFRLPDLGIGDKDAEIVAWHVAEGDHVEADAPLVAVETDKAAVEIPCPWSGRVTRLLAAKGDLVKIGAPLVEFADGVEERQRPSGRRIAATARNVRPPAAQAPVAPAAKAAKAVTIRKFLLPDLGIGDKDAHVVAWHAARGDYVAADSPLLSIETDKATIEIPSPWSGRVALILAAAGSVVKVGAPLVEIAEGEEAGRPAAEAERRRPPPRQPDRQPAPPPPAPRQPAERRPPPPRAERPPPPAPVERQPAAPELTKGETRIIAPRRPQPAPAPAREAPSAAHALARELDVDMANVEATGPGGTVTNADIERAAKKSAELEPWTEIRQSPPEMGHLRVALALIAIVLCGLFLAWWFDAAG